MFKYKHGNNLIGAGAHAKPVQSHLFSIQYNANIVCAKVKIHQEIDYQTAVIGLNEYSHAVQLARILESELIRCPGENQWPSLEYSSFDNRLGIISDHKTHKSPQLLEIQIWNAETLREFCFARFLKLYQIEELDYYEQANLYTFAGNTIDPEHKKETRELAVSGARTFLQRLYENESENI